MTAGGGGGQPINLAALWIPVMPETSHMGEEMRRAGAESKRQFEQGFNSGISPENLGQGFTSKLRDTITRGMTGFELPLGMSGVLDKFSADIDEKLVKKLKGEATQALNQYRSAYDDLTAAQGRAVEAENKVAQAREGGFNKASIMLPLISEQSKATKDLEAANKSAGSSFEEYSTKATKLSDVTKTASDSSGVMAGVMGGLVVAGANALVGAIDSVVEHIIEGAVEAFKMGVEGAKEFADKMIELGETYEQLGIQVQEFSTASGDRLEEFESHAQAVFGGLDVAGKNTGQTMAQFASILDAEPSPALDRLTGHFEELQGRFTSLKTTDLASIFNVFKTPMAEADSSMASLLQSARNSGQDLGQFASALSGNVAITLHEANLNLEQAGAFTGELLKMGEPGRQAMTGLATAMKEFGKEGLSFGDGMQLAGEKLKQLGDTAEGQDLAEKLFGTRNWIVAKQAVQDYLSIVQQGPNAFAASSSSVDEFIEHTRTLQNEWEMVKHKAEEAFLPMGLGAVQLAGTGLDQLVAYINTHMDQIKHAVTQGGIYLIGFVHDIEQFAQGLLGFFAPIADGITELLGGAIEGIASLAKGAGDVLQWIPGFENMGKGLSDAADSAFDMGDKLRTLKVGDDMRDLQKWIQQHTVDVQSATDSWVKFSEQVGTSSQDASESMTGSGVFGQGSAFNPGGPGAGLMPPNMPGAGGSAFPSPVGGAPAGTPVGGAHQADWDAIAQGESSGNWQNHDTSHKNVFGGLQIDENTWKEHGGLAYAPFPDQATKEQQIAIAEKILADQGPGAWPNTYVGFAKGGDPGRLITQGSGNGDDVAALIGRGEYVWDTETVDKYGWLIKALHGGAIGFDQGGGLDTKGAQVDTIAVAEAAQKLFGINDIGMFRSADGYNEHASGEAADVMVGDNKSLGQQVAQYFLANADQFGVQYVLWQQTQWNPDGSKSKMEDRGGLTANHMDHVHVRTLGGGFPQGADQSGFAAPSSGKTSGQPSPVAMQAFGGGGTIPGGKGGAAFPGMPGQYGGGGVYGGQTADQAYSSAQAVQEARDRASDLDYSVQKNQQRVDDLKSQLADVGNDPSKVGMLTGKPIPKTPAEQAADAKKTETLNRELEDATHQLTVSQRERAEQDGKISEAERKQGESALKPPPGGSKSQKPTGEAAFNELGSGLLSGIASDLGFGDILGKSPMDWGIVKLATGLASWGIGTANAWADEIGKGHTGLTGNQPIPGWDSGAGGSGGGGAAGGLLSGLGLPGIKNMPNVSAGANIQPGKGQIGVQGTGPAPGPVVAGDYQPINITQTQPNTDQILQPVQHLMQSSQFTAMSPHGPGT